MATARVLVRDFIMVRRKVHHQPGENTSRHVNRFILSQNEESVINCKTSTTLNINENHGAHVRICAT
jgi:hypothetical protein